MKWLTVGFLAVAVCATGLWAETTPAPESTDQTTSAQAADKPASQPQSESPATNEAADKAQAPAGASLETLAQRAGYAFGLNIGQNLKAQEIEIDIDAMARGLRDAMAGSTPQMDEQAVQMAMMELQQFVQNRQAERARVEGEKNKAAGEVFLTENKAKEGVVTTASGLQYIVNAPGEGASPKASDVVTVHYTGTLIDGTVFDSSYQRNQPATFPVGGVIAGWTEALQLMKPGAKFRLFIPSELAYGDQGVGDVIGPSAVLVFDVELISIEAGEAAQPIPAPQTPGDQTVQ